MAMGYMLDNGQPKSGTASASGAAAIHAVKTLGKAEDVFRRYTVPLVRYAKERSARRQCLPTYFDGLVMR